VAGADLTCEFEMLGDSVGVNVSVPTVDGEVLLSTHLDGAGRALRADAGVVLRL
jgi:hypothetical protein